ncbi:hypothetical protein [Endozoicomonas numazuensis]|uniref:hypothetical protein n=1 Tax=Endozoicomonas numazuensis TaxID=1137799 RepID=UPI0012678677|nr:hypothetical protein [Endozoicomonas numazuensis]
MFNLKTFYYIYLEPSDRAANNPFMESHRIFITQPVIIPDAYTHTFDYNELNFRVPARYNPIKKLKVIRFNRPCQDLI